ncbi:MAG TPA: proline--tRNA ligase [Dehalococcoidia bacterium]|nr:proline--tRNA ligase [Dehalococcoidia bacterium]
MRLSKLFGKTLKETPAEADSLSHQLLLRAGMIQQVAAGVYSYLPLGWRVLNKIAHIIREEMDIAGGQELMLPALQPFELWEESGRYPSFGRTMFTVTDRKEHKLALGPTHEEVITELVHRYVQSYRDLPLLLYQIQNKFRDEPRPRGGLLRVREFIMKDLYSFDVDESGLNSSYQKMVQAYKNIYSRCELPAVIVEADSGAIGGKESHEFMLITETGEDEIICCLSCDYAANVEKAQSIKPTTEMKAPLPLEEISTPNIKTIDEVAAFVGVPTNCILKAVFYSADGELVFVVIRGDLEVNETKLSNLLKCFQLRLATETEAKTAGLVAGSASPVGIKGIKIIADDSITLGSNFIAGANKPDTHLRNVNYPRDFKVDLIADIAVARSGDSCLKCNGKLVSTHGVEIGHVFKLGTFLSEKLGAFFLDQNSVSRPIIMGCYGIGLGRLLAAAVEQSHDDKGIIWPLAIAPYHIYLCALHSENPEVAEAAEKLYEDLIVENFEVLFDDRDESPGVKFNDADLLGIPLRLTLSPRTLQSQSVEIKWRKEKQTCLLPLEEITDKVRQLLKKAQ